MSSVDARFGVERDAPALDDGRRRVIRLAWLVTAAALVLSSAPLLLLSGPSWRILGYTLAAPVPFVLVVLRRRTVVRRREEHGYSDDARAERASLAVLALGMALALMHGFWFAYDIASR